MTPNSSPRVRSLARVSRILAAASLRALLGTALLAAVAAWLSPSAAAVTDQPSHAKGYSYGFRDTGNPNGFEYAILDPRTSSVSTSTNRDITEILDRFRGESRDVFWFSLDGKDYVARDADVVSKANQIVKPMRDLGEQQGKLGAQQSALGKQQSRLGREQGLLGRKMGELGARLGELSARDAGTGDDPDARRQVAAVRREMDSLREAQDALAGRQRPLAAQQQELGRRQEALGNRQRQAAAEATEALEKLARDAVRSGKAESVQR